MTDLSPEEAREGLRRAYPGVPSWTMETLNDNLDALAALVTWPALLEAGERAGKVTYESCETESFYRLTEPEAAPTTQEDPE